MQYFSKNQYKLIKCHSSKKSISIFFFRLEDAYLLIFIIKHSQPHHKRFSSTNIDIHLACFIRHSSYILTIMHWHIQRQHYYMHQTPEYYWLYNQDEYQSLQRHNVFYFHHNFLLPLYRKQLYLFPLQKQ